MIIVGCRVLMKEDTLESDKLIESWKLEGRDQIWRCSLSFYKTGLYPTERTIILSNGFEKEISNTHQAHALYTGNLF